MKVTIAIVLLNIALIGAKLLDESSSEKPYQSDNLAFKQDDNIIESEEKYIRSRLDSLSPRNKRFFLFSTLSLSYIAKKEPKTET